MADQPIPDRAMLPVIRIAWEQAIQATDKAHQAEEAGGYLPMMHAASREAEARERDMARQYLACDTARRGSSDPDDPDTDGPLDLVIMVDMAQRRVNVRFGGPVESLEMTAEDVGTFVQHLLTAARQVADKPFSILIPADGAEVVEIMRHLPEGEDA